jgi:glycosyltransferase involved in cell wall biosynthesis
MAARLPVVGANTSGIAELIRHNETGILFNPDDPDGPVSCIKSMIDSPALAAACAQKAYDCVKRTCDPEAVARAAVSFYAGVTNSFAKTRT